MPYFSFVIKDSATLKIIKDFGDFELNVKYYSKNTKLWTNLTKFIKKNYKIIAVREKRLRAKKNIKSILFCLPPSLGLGDTIEYALAIKSIIVNNPEKKFGVAYVGKYKNIFKMLFQIKYIYDFISEKQLENFDTVFHFTLEIDQLIFQKYNRQNIEKLITDFFQVPLYRKKLIPTNDIKKVKTLSIFPVSKSPLRSLPLFLINLILDKFISKYKIEIFLDESIISNYIYKNIKYKKKLFFFYAKTYEHLIEKIKDIDFGIFPDSGPLHIAKIFNKKGVLITSSVSKKILLNNFSSIDAIQSNYKSDYCNGPCGLVNAFEIHKKTGCYDKLSIKKEQLLKIENKKKLQRGNLINDYLNLYISSINCYKYFDDKKIQEFIESKLNI